MTVPGRTDRPLHQGLREKRSVYPRRFTLCHVVDQVESFSPAHPIHFIPNHTMAASTDVEERQAEQALDAPTWETEATSSLPSVDSELDAVSVSPGRQ
jgi:hypothetical protein